MTTERQFTQIESDFAAAIAKRPEQAQDLGRAELLLYSHLEAPGAGIIRARALADGRFAFSVESQADGSKRYAVSLAARKCECYRSHEQGFQCKHFLSAWYFARRILKLDPAQVV